MAIKAVNATQLDADLTAVADAIRAKGGTTDPLSFPDGMTEAISNISAGIVPSGTIDITTNGTHDVASKATANVQVPTGTVRTSSDVTVSGRTVTVPAGLYGSQVQKSVAQGTAGTPTASKGNVSNHAISVTPSVTNSTGYITGGTKSGSPVTVSASELVSGTRSITSNGTGIDVTNYKYVDVAVSGREGYVGQKTYEESVSRFSVSFPVDTDNLIAFLMYNTKSEFYNRLHGCIRAMFVDRNDSGKSILLVTRYANTSGDIDELKINGFQYVTVSYGTNSISVSVSDEDWNLPRLADYTLIPIYSQ